MAYSCTVYIDPIGYSPLGFRMAAGTMDDGIQFIFKNQDNTPWSDIVNWAPQLVLRPFTTNSLFAYDIDMYDPVGATGLAAVPRTVFNDDFSAEVYMRNADGAPMWMLAAGRYTLNGWGYRSSGPLGPASYPTGPAGPAGPQGASGAQGPSGAPGMRGSRWYTGAGPPAGVIPDDRVDGDMWLDETNGDVWRWSDASARWLAFKGV